MYVWLHVCVSFTCNYILYACVCMYLSVYLYTFVCLSTVLLHLFMLISQCLCLCLVKFYYTHAYECVNLFIYMRICKSICLHTVRMYVSVSFHMCFCQSNCLYPCVCVSQFVCIHAYVWVGLFVYMRMGVCLSPTVKFGCSVIVYDLHPYHYDLFFILSKATRDPLLPSLNLSDWFNRLKKSL